VNLDNRLAGKTVFVTGGGSGIGKGAAQRIAAEGGAVGVADIRLGIAEEVAAEIRSDGGQAIAIACDVADEAAVEAAMTNTVDEFGRLDGLFANAGTAGAGWLHETTLEDWRFVLGVNLDGVFFCCKHAIPHMIEGGGGSIVVTSSIAGSVAGAGGSNVSYTVSKAGVIGMARQIAVDYGHLGIRANSIQPSGVQDSNMGTHVVEDRERAGSTTPPERMRRPKPWIPLRRAGHPRDEYGATVAFLLSDDAGFITGAQLPVDGGYLST
jgi:NAD(P)-dependent dehydrogenase (short-subunit alcohol dehydrogenase family)